MKSFLSDPLALMHAAAVLSFTALAFRDQLKLRTVLLFSIILSLSYHIVEQSEHSWQEAFWNVVTLGINAKVLAQIIIDRTHIGLSKEDEELFSSFNSLTPGEFRSLMKIGAWKTAGHDTKITIEGVIPEYLFYVLGGSITIDKNGRTIIVDPKTFIGEVAFLHETPASATVSLEPGSRYVQWPVSQLRKRIGSKPALTNSVMRLIGLDMALKIARS